MLINTDKLKSIISAIKAYIKPADYAQNDSTARDYIKNRPFYDAREAGGELKKIDSKYISAPDWSQNDPDGEGYVANRTHWREKVDELESTYDNLPVSINMLLWTTYDTQAITTMLGHYTTNNYLYNADWSNNPCPIMLYSVGGSSSVSTVLRMFISPLQNIKSVAVYNADGSLIGQATTDYTDIFKDKNGNTVTDNQGRTLYVGALVGTITLGSNSYDSGCTNYLYSIKIVQTDEYSYHPIDLNYFPDDIKYTAYNKSSATNLENGSGRYSLQQKSYGNQNNASGYGSFTIGVNATASGAESFASGQNSVASGTGSFASGGSKASAHYAHAEGCVTEASGYGAHSEGNTTTASGNYSHAEGFDTTAQRKSQHAQGEYNVLDTTGSATTRGTYAHIVGNGTSASKRSNAHTLDWSGNAWFAGDVYTRSTSGTNKDAGSKKLATEELVNTAQSTADEAKLAAADANTKAGNLDNLKTAAKDNLVEAINEAATVPDYNQNDETAPDYIKNRPFWDTRTEETVFSFEMATVPAEGLYKVPDFDYNKVDKIYYSGEYDGDPWSNEYTTLSIVDESTDYNLPNGSIIRLNFDDSGYYLMTYYASAEAIAAVSAEVSEPGWYFYEYEGDVNVKVIGVHINGELKTIDEKYMNGFTKNDAQIFVYKDDGTADYVPTPRYRVKMEALTEEQMSGTAGQIYGQVFINDEVHGITCRIPENSVKTAAKIPELSFKIAINTNVNLTIGQSLTYDISDNSTLNLLSKGEDIYHLAANVMNGSSVMINADALLLYEAYYNSNGTKYHAWTGLCFDASRSHLLGVRVYYYTGTGEGKLIIKRFV